MSTLKVDTIQDRSSNQKGTLRQGTPCVMNPVVLNTVNTQAHGLSSTPSMIETYLECTTSELGYSVGDRVFMQFKDSGAGSFGFIVEYDSTNVRILQASTAPQVLNRATPTEAISITLANWKIVAVPYIIN